jgi:hypothetical protein
MSGEQVNMLIGTGQLLFAALVFFRIDAKALKRKGSLADITFEPKRRITRTKVIALLIAGGFAFSGYGFYRTFATQKTAASSQKTSDVQKEITRLRATVKRFEDKEAEEAAREWPPLTSEEITKWADTLRPLHIQEFYVFWNQEVEARRFFATLKEVARQAGIVDFGAASGGGTPGKIEISTRKDDPAGPVLVRLFKTLTSTVELKEEDDGRGIVLITIGERIR